MIKYSGCKVFLNKRKNKVIKWEKIRRLREQFIIEKKLYLENLLILVKHYYISAQKNYSVTIYK